MSEGRMPFNKKVYLTKEDVEDLKLLKSKGVLRLLSRCSWLTD